MSKTLSVTSPEDATRKIPDIQFFGDPDTWTLISKAYSEKQGWMKSTKAIELDKGVVINVSTQQRNPDGSFAVAEAMVFVKKATIGTRANGDNVIM